MDPATKSFVAVAVLLLPESVMLLPMARFCGTAKAQSSLPWADAADAISRVNASEGSVRVTKFIFGVFSGRTKIRLPVRKRHQDGALLSTSPCWVRGSPDSMDQRAC